MIGIISRPQSPAPRPSVTGDRSRSSGERCGRLRLWPWTVNYRIVSP